MLVRRLTASFSDGVVAEELAGGVEGKEVACEERAVELRQAGDDDGAVDAAAREAIGHDGGGRGRGCGRSVGGWFAHLPVTDADLHPFGQLVEPFRDMGVIEPRRVEDTEAILHGPENVVLFQASRLPVAS
ncbi:hypothetical protein HPP92_015420 [Vanilla planifolia]|uniref:Uncharacterized protein n=1 Tax=Vanilla planifolia TaxID=51239 RepID=A0A835UU12_VANPL|nr:hypothetical protein HPP92_015420 [Vanilla planifolia]